MSCQVDLVAYCAGIGFEDCTGGSTPAFTCQAGDAVCVPAIDSTDLTRVECLQQGSTWTEVGTSGDAIMSAGEQVMAQFYSAIPFVVGVIVAIILSLWGVRWILSKFGR
jgi:hypothetical protein